ncbi:putative ABC1 family [Trypanosoma vivax]|nr:putative ABC1 family [Trypanosoma vivax]
MKVGSLSHLLFVGGSVGLATCGAVLAVYYGKVWLPERRRLLQREQLLPPSRRTPYFVAGSGDALQGLLLHNRKQWGISSIVVFYAVAVARVLLLSIHVFPLLWYAFLAYGPRLCQERVLHEKLRASLTALGPTYIKLGQWIATRPDIFPPALCSVLEKLYDSTEPHSWAHTEKLLRHALQREASNDEEQRDEKALIGDRRNALYYLRAIEKCPVNSGSIAQVHRGVLRDEVDGIPAGTEVAVKVLHPWTRELIAVDLLVMRCFVSVLAALVPGAVFFDLHRGLREFSNLLCSQLDLRTECENLQQFAFNFRDFPGVVFPRPLPSLCTQDVLVETFEEGQSLKEIQSGECYRELAERGCHMFLKMLFEDNFVHSDLHPGNILLRTNPGAPISAGSAVLSGSPRSSVPRHPDGKPKLRHELVVLDAGLTTTLSKRERDNFISLFAAVACGDGSLGADLMLERLPSTSKVSHSDEERQKLRSEMSEIFDLVAPGRSDGFKLSRIHIGPVLCKIMNTLRENRTPIDGNFASLVLTVVVGEGLGRKLMPEFNIFAEAAPYLMALLGDSELCFLANKLRQTYGTGTLLCDSLSVARLERTPTYVTMVFKKACKTIDNVLEFFTEKPSVSICA